MVLLVAMVPVTSGSPWNGLGTSVFQSSVSSGRPVASKLLDGERYFCHRSKLGRLLIQVLRDVVGLVVRVAQLRAASP